MESSRRFVNLNVSREVFKLVIVNNEENDNEQKKSFIDGYKTRPISMEGVTLIDAAKSWIYNPRRRDKWADFCLSDLLLYKPFCNIERDIGHDNDSIKAKWESFNDNPWHVERIITLQNVEATSDFENEENGTIQQNTIEHEWEIISRLHDSQHMQHSEIDMLGKRDIDRSADWSNEYQGEEYTVGAINFISNMKEHGCLIYDDIPQCINYTTLSDKQQKAVNIIMTHYYSNREGMHLFMIIQGTTGTGKSYLIGAINQSFQNATMPCHSLLLLLAPTGVVAFNIGASIVHSKLKIPIRDFSELEGTRLTSFQEEMPHIKYILIDEMSFIGQNMLENTDSRLRQAFPQSADMSFAYKVFRQDGENIQQQRFRQLLTNLRDANPKIDDWRLLMMITPISLDVASNNDFDNAVHLFSTNENVHNHNKRMLYSLNHPIACSLAARARSVNTIEDCSNDELDLDLLISKNSRVMLNSNLWIKAGLVN
ncbi:uncharacterized protein LOC131075850 [Cryptomeria japonica]|uniref:uncharacterized protein LOC131075850 n=1 Tax=Cryptomeria japonica TaxID=3369 RepID=UPI0027DA6569|nr:uncharacterized protein LOC131075850 [Cryptomeria japonica]